MYCQKILFAANYPDPNEPSTEESSQHSIKQKIRPTILSNLRQTTESIEAWNKWGSQTVEKAKAPYDMILDQKSTRHM